MLLHVDVFVGVALVMLGVSLLLTVVTQLVSFTFNLRGNQLHKGLHELFAAIASSHGLELAQPEALAEKILHHPLIADGVGVRRLAPAISRADLTNILPQIEEVTAMTADQVKTLTEEVGKWFDATMSRVSNRFTMQTRLVTIAGATIAAVLLHLDAFGLVTRLYADSDLRARMVGAADAMIGKGQTILANPGVFASVATKLAKEAGLPGPELAPQTLEQAHAWIRKVAPNSNAAIARYDALFAEAVQPAVKNWLGEAADVKGQLDAAGFSLVVQPYRPFSYASFWEVLGVLASAALLSLGAPFWFNALKAASNLRPAMAAQVEGREAAAPKT